ncbi:MAG: hypothetical protein HN846_02580 [Candidatus Pacebacteria bacterium]|nr:hypothetical protein [Candidatus Paceibacterota bacterium]MBT3511747.1 hypothetical protein [Candidatus Paceibacterota bacterium]MBT4005172.1 hypothetical protein [Candidatus Paceibacterota bacterium]MBT4358998.1 hypothetical protein [Candidatus Paceibacterota bacterium]MBT4681273.1 hypothetical protein [Candidatus Paceibacterota bacterium]
MKNILKILHLKKESPREKYLRFGLRGLLFVAVFLAGYLTAKLQTLFLV